MCTNALRFVSWEERILCQERGKRVVHFYVKDEAGESVLAVIGTERSIRHMMYVLSDEFVQAHGSKVLVNAGTKWRARRDVVDWLKSIVSNDSLMSDLSQGFGSLQLSSRMSTRKKNLADQMVHRKLKVQNSDIEWSGVPWICAKQLKHYPAFCRNETIIAVHAFVFIMAEEAQHYIGYVEDMYEDKKGQKKVKVRWFHHNQEINELIPDLNPHPQEVFITPHVQVISAECIDGLAIVLTRKHYEECVTSTTNNFPSGFHMCFRQFKNSKVKPFTLTKLRGYSSQAILSSFDDTFVSKTKQKGYNLIEKRNKERIHDNPSGVCGKRSRSYKDQEELQNGTGYGNSAPGYELTNSVQIHPKLKLRLSRETMDIKFVMPEMQCPSFRVDEKIELLCQDSGIRGCWFRCKILRVSKKKLKVQYQDLENVEYSGKLEEWVPAFKVAAPDKLGMRYPGRQVIRPFPTESEGPMNCVYDVGAPVDAWWCDGWWEGVVTGVDISGNDTLQVYFPGERRFLMVETKDLRVSKDWVDNQWVDIKAKTDILSYLSANGIPGIKLLPSCTNNEEVSRHVSTVSPDHKVLTPSTLDTLTENKQELPVDGASNDVNKQDLPVEGASNDVNKQELPVEGASNDVNKQELPVEGASNDVNKQELPVEGASNDVNKQELPVEGASNDVNKQELPVDGASNVVNKQELPVEGASNDVNKQELPVDGAPNDVNKLHKCAIDGSNGLGDDELMLEANENNIDDGSSGGDEPKQQVLRKDLEESTNMEDEVMIAQQVACLD